MFFHVVVFGFCRTFLPVLHDGMLIYNNITGFVLYFSTIRKVGKERSGNFGAEEIVGWVWASSAYIFSFVLFFFFPNCCFYFLQFNCFLLMPVVDKLPALLREDLESAFEGDLDNVFDITNLRHSLSQQKSDTEIEMKRVF